jgi:hypothetical protein
MAEVEHMEKRLTTVEGEIGGLKTSVSALSVKVDGLTGGLNSVGSDVKTLTASLDKFISRSEATKPLSYTTILTTVAVTGTVVGMVVGGLFFLIDARVSTAVQESAHFTHEWSAGGRLYLLERDVELLKRYSKQPPYAGVGIADTAK